MVTPFDAGGGLDLARAEELATHLVDLGNDGLVVNGTTGEGPTTTDTEKAELVRAVVERGGRAGHGGRRGRHLRHRAQRAPGPGRREGRRTRPAGGHARTTPGRRRPGLLAHFTAVADATDLPVMLYDIPPRSVVADRGGHPAAAGRAPADRRGQGRPRRLRGGHRDDRHHRLAYYCGDDPVNLPWLSVGAVGFVSVIGHVVADRLRVMVDAYEAGDVAGPARDARRHVPGDPGDGPLRRRGVRQGRAAAARGRRRRPAATAASRPRRSRSRAIADDLAEAGVPLARAHELLADVAGADRGAGVGSGVSAS